MELSIYFIMFICGVVLTSTYFLTKRNEKANDEPLKQCAKHIQELMRRMDKIESEKSSFTVNQEIKDAVKLVREEQAVMRDKMSEVMMNFNLEMMSLITHRRKTQRRDHGKTNRTTSESAFRVSQT